MTPHLGADEASSAAQEVVLREFRATSSGDVASGRLPERGYIEARPERTGGWRRGRGDFQAPPWRRGQASSLRATHLLRGARQALEF